VNQIESFESFPALPAVVEAMQSSLVEEAALLQELFAVRKWWEGKSDAPTIAKLHVEFAIRTVMLRQTKALMEDLMQVLIDSSGVVSDIPMFHYQEE
jgi:hypothetical protein